MFEVYLTNSSFGKDSAGSRNRFHETALREARIATDYRQVATAAPARAGLVSRLRLAIAGGPAITTTEPSNCPA